MSGVGGRESSVYSMLFFFYHDASDLWPGSQGTVSSTAFKHQMGIDLLTKMLRSAVDLQDRLMRIAKELGLGLHSPTNPLTPLLRVT